jgi:hypothetical protein
MNNIPELFEQWLLISSEISNEDKRKDEDSGNYGGFIRWVLRLFAEDDGRFPPSK